jgi:ubiquinone/menaquinone biosynthesis C-methylase UbiE
MLKNLFGRFISFCRKDTVECLPNESTTEYWTRRVKQFGKRSVLNLGHSARVFETVTNHQKKEIYPFFVDLLNGDEELLLDLGCGPGRFTCDLADLIKGRAIGTDIIEDLLVMAPRQDRVEYRLMEEGNIPLSDEQVDVVWVCLLLGGIRGDLLTKTVQEIRRVLKSGGLLFLVENTSEIADEKHWAYRQVQQYTEMFSFAPLMMLHEYDDLEQRISLMAGRKL